MTRLALIVTGDLIRIDAGFACFGLIARNGIVVHAPPICRWAVGKRAEPVMAYWQKRGATVETIAA